MPSGRAPIARTSETLVTTAAEPAPNGSASRNGGEIASPQMTKNPSPCGTSAASSPSRPGVEARDDVEVALAEQAGRRPDERHQRVQICHRGH